MAETAAVRTVRADATSGLTVEWSRLAGLKDIVSEWRDLAACVLEPNVFYEPAFALPAATVFGHGVGAALVWTQGPRRLVGFFPGRVHRRYGVVPVVTGWTHRFAPLGTPLVNRDHAAAAVAAWLAWLRNDDRLPALMILPLIPEGPFTAILNDALADTSRIFLFNRHRRAMLAPADPPSPDRAFAIIPKKRKELRRQRRRLAELGGLAVDVATDRAAVAAALADFIELEARGWKGRTGTAAKNDARIHRFVESAVAGLAAEGKVRIDRLQVGGRPIAAVVTLRGGDVAWTWKIAYDESYARYSPGVQLMCDVSRALLADATIRQVDSCASAGHPMIDHLWRARIELADRLIALRPSPIAFPLVRQLEAVRSGTVPILKAWRDRWRGRSPLRPARATGGE
jgi:CelD/BcsL family acetyltransferase involved in cellulose biosynthesis